MCIRDSFTLEEPAAPHEIVRLEDDTEVNRALWEDERGLRGFYWHYPVRGAKPGAQVVAFAGAGGFLLSGQELVPADQHKLPVKVLL